MSLVLNTNLNSLVAQNNLTTNGGKLATSLQQLSSGMRINTAADDAAGIPRRKRGPGATKGRAQQPLARGEIAGLTAPEGLTRHAAVRPDDCHPPAPAREQGVHVIMLSGSLESLAPATSVALLEKP